MRTCVACRRVASPTELVRVRRVAAGGLAVGPGPGRGAWLCGADATAACLARALRHRALERALRAPVTAPEIDALRARLGG
jgi:predicted RNA-binding protein YlxR (DUF448 family)